MHFLQRPLPRHAQCPKGAFTAGAFPGAYLSGPLDHWREQPPSSQDLSCALKPMHDAPDTRLKHSALHKKTFVLLRFVVSFTSKSVTLPD
jgi:hypothetical protein